MSVAVAFPTGRPEEAEVIPFRGPLRRLDQEPTPRELEVLQLIADGFGNRAIARRLFISEETVKSHVRHVLAKFEVNTRSHAIATAFRAGLIS